jgi:hypothetical protein
MALCLSSESWGFGLYGPRQAGGLSGHGVLPYCTSGLPTRPGPRPAVLENSLPSPFPHWPVTPPCLPPLPSVPTSLTWKSLDIRLQLRGHRLGYYLADLGRSKEVVSEGFPQWELAFGPNGCNKLLGLFPVAIAKYLRSGN